jgi:hypothetical protein
MKTEPISKLERTEKRKPGRKPGSRKTGGRQPGTPNKISLTVKQAIIDTFAALGGVKHMETWARKRPTEFYKIAARLIPVEMSGPDGGAIPISFQAPDYEKMRADASAKYGTPSGKPGA